jgi:hypothetical protein
MRIFANKLRNEDTTSEIDPFEDPVAYLAGLGIEAVLVEVDLNLSEAA